MVKVTQQYYETLWRFLLRRESLFLSHVKDAHESY